jgi:hypothetical protein
MVPCGWLAPRLPGLAPAGESLLWPSKEVTKKDAPTKPPTRWVGSLRCSKPQARAQLAPLRSARTVARSQLLKCASRTPGVPALLGGFEGGVSEQPNSQQPSPTAVCRRLFIHPPFESAEKHRTLRPFAQRTSRTDFVRLFERRVAERVPHEASRSEHRRAARCEAKGRTVRGRLFAYFLVAQKVGRPPGRTPGIGLAVQAEASNG